jgi:hypothetical protein
MRLIADGDQLSVLPHGLLQLRRQSLHLRLHIIETRYNSHEKEGSTRPYQTKSTLGDWGNRAHHVDAAKRRVQLGERQGRQRQLVRLRRVVAVHYCHRGWRSLHWLVALGGSSGIPRRSLVFAGETFPSAAARSSSVRGGTT